MSTKIMHFIAFSNHSLLKFLFRKWRGFGGNEGGPFGIKEHISGSKGCSCGINRGDFSKELLPGVSKEKASGE